MKLIFKGLRREVYPHEHSVKPAPMDMGEFLRRKMQSKTQNHPEELLTWDSPTFARGEIHDVKLSGDFFVEFEFQETELKNWLEKYVASDPKAAIKLLAELQLKAANSLRSEDNTGDQ